LRLQPFKQVFKDIYPLLAAKKKPIILGEMSSAEAGGDKSRSVVERASHLKVPKSNRMPELLPRYTEFCYRL
jgi:hypothetical protein